jgi:photosystem I subunit X
MPTLLAAAIDTSAWSPKIAIVMIGCNILAIAIAKATVQQPAVGPMPPSESMFGGFSIGTILGATSLGHVIGAGAILGMGYMGVL